MEQIHSITAWLAKHTWAASWLGAAATLIAAIGAIVTLALIWRQIRIARLALGADLIFRADEKFYHMRKERKEAAECLLSFKKGSKDDKADDVLDFFDTIGMLVRRKSLEKEVSWSVFYWWVVGYWEAAQRCDYIESKKKEYGEQTWEDFEKLYEETKKWEGEEEPWGDEKIDNFLNKEKSLSITAAILGLS